MYLKFFEYHQKAMAQNFLSFSWYQSATNVSSPVAQARLAESVATAATLDVSLGPARHFIAAVGAKQ